MKRVIGLVFGFGAASCIVAGAPAAEHPSHLKPAVVAKVSEADMAPADEYFGYLKLSILGINNRIRDLGLYYDVNHDIPAKTLAGAQSTEEAIHDWEGKYRLDPLLPRSVYYLQRLYSKILTADARRHAARTADWLFGDFRTSPQARQLRKVLAVEHLAPLPTPPPAPPSSSPTLSEPVSPSQSAASPAPSPTS